jgi:hypothetical protein
MALTWGTGGVTLHTVNLNTRWRWVISFIPQPLYPWGKSPWYALDSRLGGSQSQSGHGEEKKSLPHPCWEMNPGHPAHNLVIMLTAMPVLKTHTQYLKSKLNDL